MSSTDDKLLATKAVPISFPSRNTDTSMFSLPIPNTTPLKGLPSSDLIKCDIASGKITNPTGSKDNLEHILLIVSRYFSLISPDFTQEDTTPKTVFEGSFTFSGSF